MNCRINDASLSRKHRPVRAVPVYLLFISRSVREIPQKFTREIHSARADYVHSRLLAAP